MVKRTRFTSFLLLGCLCGVAWPVPVTFNDPALLSAVKTQWETATGLTLSDPPEDTELSNPLFTSLDARGLGIVDLTGLEACSALTHLNLGMNLISSVTPLSGLTNLVKLNIGIGTDLLENMNGFNPYLTGANAITDLSPLAGLVNLEYLNVMGDEGITSIAAISTMDSLMELWLMSNPIADFSPLGDIADTVSVLAIANCGLHNPDIAVVNTLTSLTTLGIIAEPNLTDISGLTGLHALTAFSLLITGVADASVVSTYTGLTQLVLMFNPITAIPDLSGLSSLQVLMAAQSQFTDISGLSGLTNLQQLFLNNNGISDIDALETCTSLKTISLQNNQITDIQPLIDNTGISGLQSLDITDNPFFAGTPFCDDHQLDQLTALAPSAQISANTACGAPVTLTISVTGMGATEPAPGTYTYSLGERITLRAKPISGSGWAFGQWSGDSSSSEPYVDILLDGDKSVEAVFVSPGDYTLTIQRSGAGSGSTFPEPGIYSYLAGDEQWVTAGTHAGSYFAGWQGDASGYMLSQSVIMNRDKTVIASFATSGFNLTLNTSGNGWIRNFSLGTTGFVAGAVLELWALDQNGWVFEHWEGDIGGAGAQNRRIQITMDQPRAITAVFSAVSQKQLTISINGPGTTSPSPGVHGYTQGSTAWVQALPNSGSAFDHWEGDIGGANPYQSSINLVMDQDRGVTAFFVPAVWTLTLQKNGNGMTSPVPGVYGYTNGANENFSCQLIPGGDAFDRWTGDLMQNSDPVSLWQNVSMTQNRTITAEFVPGDWTLTIGTEGGEGYCQPDPAPGVYSYLEGRTANITLYACDAAYFAGWSGDASGYAVNTSVLMDGNKSVTAHYSSTGFTLTTAISGQGWLNLGTNSRGFAAGATFDVVANTSQGYVFDHWEGDVPAGEDTANPTLPVVMDMNRNLTAVFREDMKILTIIIDGPGSTSPAGSPAPGTQYIYTTNQNACIQTALASDVAFDHWSGDVGNADVHWSSLCVLMDQDRTITAHFVEPAWTLNLQVTGNGTTSPPPGVYGYAEGGNAGFGYVLLDGGDAFSHWTGDIGAYSATTQGLSLLMNQNRTVTANFVPGNWTLTVSKSGDPDGSVNPNPGVYAYLNGREASVTVNTSLSAYFAGWTGDVDSDMPSLVIPMDGNKAITANFSSTGYVLNMAVEGSGGVNVPQTSYFSSGMEPVLRATAQNGWKFDHWSGDLPEGADSSNPELPVLINQNRNLTAHFVMEGRTLTILIEGEGSTNPAGAPEPGISYEYSINTLVWVEAELGVNGWAFSHWSGDIGSADPYRSMIALTMNQDRAIVANYVPADWSLTLSYTGTGSTWPAPGAYGYMDGAPVEVVANIVTGGDAFNHWEGAGESMDTFDPGQRFTIHGNMTLTAVFTPGDYTLTSTVTGGGIAEYISHPAGVYQYMAGRTANLEVRPRYDTYWGGYSGDVTTFDYTSSLLMDADKNVTITLGTSGYELVVNESGGGLTNPTGASRFVAGAMPTIHAIDRGSSLFDYWSGELSLGMDPYERDPIILMDESRTVIANFKEADFYLYIQVIGNGTTNPVPGLYWHMNGDLFEITATPGAEFLFLQWQGNVPAGQDPASRTISGTIDQNVELIAVFVPESVTVPDLSGKTQAEAEAALAVLGLVLGEVTQEYSDTVLQGHVITQNPIAATSVVYGSVVSIVVSYGPCIAPVPNLIGLPQSEAEAALAAANLTLGTITQENSDTVPAGHVISQDPVFGLSVACDTPAAVVISLGPVIEGEGEEGEVEGETDCHTADQNCDGLVNLSELLRVIQFFNSNGFHCETGTEDGYAPGPGDTTCAPYDSDYNTQDWHISLSELLRVIQFFNSGGYHYCPSENTEDGFCPGIS